MVFLLISIQPCISDDLSRSFYEKQSINDNWSVHELKRQRQTGLFERIALSKDKAGVLKGRGIAYRSAVFQTKGCLLGSGPSRCSNSLTRLRIKK